MFKLRYNPSTGQILSVDSRLNETLIEDHFCSEPNFNDDNTIAVYVAPLEWDTDSNLMLFYLNSGKMLNITPSLPDTEIIKQAVWINKDQLAIIIGKKVGSTSIGGNVFRIGVQCGELENLTRYDEKKEQAINIAMRDGMLLADIIEFNDHDAQKFTRKQAVIPI